MMSGSDTPSFKSLSLSGGSDLPGLGFLWFFHANIEKHSLKSTKSQKTEKQKKQNIFWGIFLDLKLCFSIFSNPLTH